MFLCMDACFETDTFSGGGAVPVDSRGVWCQFFSQQIHTDLLRRITVTSKKNAIFELEFFFCDLVLSVCVEGIANGFQLVTYTDIDGVRDALIAIKPKARMVNPILRLV